LELAEFEELACKCAGSDELSEFRALACMAGVTAGVECKETAAELPPLELLSEGEESVEVVFESAERVLCADSSCTGDMWFV